MKITKSGIHWGLNSLRPEYREPGREPYYFCWTTMSSEMRDAIRKDNSMRNVGLVRFWHDGPHAQLNLYYVCFYWSTPYTLPPEEYRR